MTDGVFPDRLNQLRARWESDPASRIFLQLAEEYRHLGRVQDALAVLDKGLEEHPGYLSALVAKGRCHLELADGESARVVLERVVKQDATQMVANKLLVRAYLETGDPVKARERLDLYSLLNDSDPEIEDLRRRIRQLERPAPPEKPPETPGTETDPFSLEAPPAGPDDPTLALPRNPGLPADVFDLNPPAPARRGGDDIFDLEPAAPARVAAAPPPAPVPVMVEPEEPTPEEEEEPASEENLLFPGLSSRDSRRRYLAALGAEGLFAFEPAASPARVPPAPAPPAPVQPPPPAPSAPVLAAPAPLAPPPPLPLTAEPFAPAPGLAEEASWLDDAAGAAPAGPAPAPEPLMPAIFEPEPPVPVFEPEQRTTAEELWSEEPAPEPVFTEPELLPEPEPPMEAMEAAPAGPAPQTGTIATATLGEIYFRQGHYAEAERIFREVLEREPGSAAARGGLERLAALGPQPETPRLDARRLLAGYRPDARRPADVEARSRKIFLLSRYLERLRQGSPYDVS
jgi:tetratricopeptide (TPR) repeat protein